MTPVLLVTTAMDKVANQSSALLGLIVLRVHATTTSTCAKLARIPVTLACRSKEIAKIVRRDHFVLLSELVLLMIFVNLATTVKAVVTQVLL